MEGGGYTSVLVKVSTLWCCWCLFNFYYGFFNGVFFLFGFVMVLIMY